MRGLARKFRETGVKLAVVVQVQPDELADTCGFTRDLLTIADPDRTSHRAMGFGSMSGWRMLLPGPMWRARRRAKAGGFTQNMSRTFKKESDWTLNPGAALIDRRGRILWLHRGEHIADLPAADDLLAVAQEHVVRTRSRRRRT